MITDDGENWHYLVVKSISALINVKMPDEDDKILKYKRGEKSLKAPFISIADLECILSKIGSSQNNPEKSYTEIKAKHEP